MQHPEIGTVIHGTLRNEDLLDAFARTLADCVASNWELPRAQCEKYTQLVIDARKVYPDSEEASDIIVELFDALDHFAPPGATFGAHEGDGSDFGFWPCEQD